MQNPSGLVQPSRETLYHNSIKSADAWYYCVSVEAFFATSKAGFDFY